MNIRDKVRPIYQELQGYLRTFHSITDPVAHTSDTEIWDRYNQAIVELNSIVASDHKDYSKFLIKPISGSFGNFIRLMNFQSSISGLVDRIYGDYFTDESRPSINSPSTVFSQIQSQNVEITYVLNLQEQILGNLQNQKLEPEERGFLEKIKSTLGSTKNMLELFAIILKTASEFGLTPEKIKVLLGL